MTDETITALMPLAMAIIGLGKLYIEMMKARIEADTAFAELRRERKVPCGPNGYRRKTNYYPWRRKYAGPTQSPSPNSGQDIHQEESPSSSEGSSTEDRKQG